MKLDIAEDDYNAQKAFVEALCDLKNEYNCHIHLVVHPRKGIDESKVPGKLDVKGTGALSDLADNCFIVWRNKAKEKKRSACQSNNSPLPPDLEEQVDCLWICDKQRNGSWEGKVGLWFHPASLQYLAHPESRPFQFVSYSSITQE